MGAWEFWALIWPWALVVAGLLVVAAVLGLLVWIVWQVAVALAAGRVDRGSSGD
ncbi:hypothetical protein ACXR2W_00900 [Leucobacter sp. HY1908]